MSALPAVETFVREPLPGEQRGAENDAETSAGVRAYLGAVRAHLAELHRAGASGATVNQVYSDAMDRLVRRLVRRAESIHYADGGRLEGRLAVAAVGGYGRREMAFHSDVDLLFLYGGKLTPDAENVAKRVQLWLWDAGLTVGGAVRTVRESISLARKDPSVCTSILDARFLSGDTRVFHDFSQTVHDDLMAQPEGFVRAQQKALAERRARFGDSLYLLQPNVKEGEGGLRDYHAAHWVARASLPSFRDLEDLLHVGLLTETEMDELRAALDFLWRVRNELHMLSGRKADQLSFEHQERIAAAFDYAAQGVELPVERFMGDYYRRARAIRTLSEMVIEQCLARVRPERARPVTRQAEDGFRLAEDHLEIPHATHLRERPLRLLTAFAVAQDHDVPLSRTALRMVRENLDLVDDDFRREREATRTLLRILDAKHRVMRTLMAMNEVGLLGRFLPEWEPIECRWQHVVYHTYTVDVHSIFLVEELRLLWLGRHERARPVLTELARSVPDRPALFLGALLHDIGKGRGGDHSSKGEVLARTCLERIGLEPEQIERVTFLVRYHLLMSHIAQRRDLSDARVIVELARVVRDRENLRNLYLLTYADHRASSATGWSDWKGHLLRELFERTAEFLESGRDDPSRAVEQIEARVEKRREAARRELRQLGVAEEQIDAYFRMMPHRYFVTHMPRQIARHAQLVLSYSPEQDMATSVREMRGGFSEFLICTRDVPGLYANVAGSLTAANINILGSHVYTTRTELALEVYRVTTPPGGDEEKRLCWERLEQVLHDVLSGKSSVAELLHKRGRPIGRPLSPSRQPPSVWISNEESDFYTIIDVSADDRLGLLHDLVSTLTEHGLDIYISKATTILDQVADTFYVKDRERRKLSEGAVARLQQALLEVTGREPAGE